MSDLASIEGRLSALERGTRRWKFACAALALLAIGLAADSAVKDAEFGTVKAKSFQVVDSKGEKLGSLELGKSGDHAGLVVTNAEKTKAVAITPGRPPFIVDN